MTKSRSKKLASLFGPLAMVGGVFMLGFGEKQRSALLGSIGFLIFAVGLFFFIWSSPVPPLTQAERRDRFALIFEITPGANKFRQVVETLGWLAVILGGPLLTLKALQKYPPVDENVLLYIFPIPMVLFFLVFSHIDYCKSIGTTRLTGWLLIWILTCEALVAGFLCGGILLWINGAYDQTQEVHRVVWLDKQAVGGKKLEFRVYSQSWRDPNRQIRLVIPAEVYDGLEPGKPLELTVGGGLLKVEWVRSISLP
jgi:hypothetical protein